MYCTRQEADTISPTINHIPTGGYTMKEYFIKYDVYDRTDGSNKYPVLEYRYTYEKHITTMTEYLNEMNIYYIYNYHKDMITDIPDSIDSISFTTIRKAIHNSPDITIESFIDGIGIDYFPVFD